MKAGGPQTLQHGRGPGEQYTKPGRWSAVDSGAIPALPYMTDPCGSGQALGLSEPYGLEILAAIDEGLSRAGAWLRAGNHTSVCFFVISLLWSRKLLLNTQVIGGKCSQLLPSSG